MNSSEPSNQLVDFLNCEALDLNLFRGQSRDFKTGPSVWWAGIRPGN